MCMCMCICDELFFSERASYHEYIIDELADNFEVVFYSQQATQKVTEPKLQLLTGAKLQCE